MQWLPVSKARIADSVGRLVEIRGWVRTRRDSKGGFSFLEINDGSCLGNLQVIVPSSLPNYHSDVLKLNVGASVTVRGELKASPGKGQATELAAADLVVLGLADPGGYPLQKKGASLEFLRSIAHLRPRTNTFGAVSRVRNQVCSSIHSFFQERGFLYVNTPIITASDCEGAGQMFRVTTLDAQNPPRNPDGSVDHDMDFFGKPTHLTVSGQLEGEALACALGRIYTFGPTFRAENSNTTRHLSEFWMVEPEVAFFQLEDNMDLAEAFLRRIASDALNHCAEDIQFFAERIDPNIRSTLLSLAEEPFERLSYTEAVARLANSGEVFEHPVKWGMDLQSEHERWITEKLFRRPAIVHDYPREIKAFYMRLSDDGKTVRAMDVLAPRVGEIIGGSQREERLEILESRMRECGLDPDAYSWYLDLRRFGTVPHAGFGLGLERAVQMITGMTNIRDVIPFPRAPRLADF